jgi:cold shock CspA family protein
MPTGTIKLFDREKGCGCVQADGDRVVHFFHRACVAPEYLPRKGDRVAFNVRANPRSGGSEAYQIQLLAAA